MSNTIQARHYSARQATMRQLRPGMVIDTAESFSAPSSQFIDVVTFGNVIDKSRANALLVVLVDAERATTAIHTAEIGNDSVDVWNQWEEATKAALQTSTVVARPAPAAAGRIRVDRIAVTNAVLGLSTLDFARVLGLSRQGLYKWFDATKDVKLQEASLERLVIVERIAKQWRDRSAATLAAVVNEPLANGQTALSMMIADTIDEAAVVGAFDELMAKMQDRPKSMSGKLADAGFTRRSSARSLPADE